MVSFPEEQFGMGKNAKGEPAPYGNVHFTEGMLALDPKEQKKLLERMRKHNGIGIDFWEEDEATTQASGMFFGEATAVTPESGVTDQDTIDLDTLERASIQMPNTKMSEVQDALSRVMYRFNVRGIPKPTDGLSMRRLKARITEVLGLLEDKGLWSQDDGRADIK